MLPQGLPQLPHPFLGTDKLPRVDPLLVHSDLPGELLDFFRPAGVLADLCIPAYLHGRSCGMAVILSQSEQQQQQPQQQQQHT